MKNYVITANDLRDGLNVYLIHDAAKVSWTTDFKQATIIDAEHIDEVMALAKADMQDNKIVDAYQIEVGEDNQPLSAREKIRAQGPSIKYGHDV